MGQVEFSKSMTMIILYHHHHYNAQGGDVEVHIRQKMGGRNEVNLMKPLSLALISHNMIIHNLTSKSMVTDVKVPCLTKRRSVTLKLSGLTKLVTNWTTKVEKR